MASRLPMNLSRTVVATEVTRWQDRTPLLTSGATKFLAPMRAKNAVLALHETRVHPLLHGPVAGANRVPAGRDRDGDGLAGRTRQPARLGDFQQTQQGQPSSDDLSRVAGQTA